MFSKKVQTFDGASTSILLSALTRKDMKRFGHGCGDLPASVIRFTRGSYADEVLITTTRYVFVAILSMVTWSKRHQWPPREWSLMAKVIFWKSTSIDKGTVKRSYNQQEKCTGRASRISTLKMPPKGIVQLLIINWPIYPLTREPKQAKQEWLEIRVA